MDKEENFDIFNEEINISNKQNKSNTPDKFRSNLTMSNINKIKSISLENKLNQEKNNNILIKNNIKYGIDENGNPINIKEYYKSINDSINLNSNTSIFSGLTSLNQKLKKPIAYITKDENNNNILIDLKGNKITTKNKDGDYYFPLQLHVIIKDFDVKHPELRINGERYYKDLIDDIEDIEITKEINEKENDNSPMGNIIDDLGNNKYNINEKFKGDNNSLYNNNLKKNLGSVIFRAHTNNNKYYKKLNKNINLFENDNKVVLRTSDILNNSNSQSPDSFRNNINNLIKNNGNISKTKNRNYRGHILRNNTSNCLNLIYKRDLNDIHKEGNNFKLKMNKSTLQLNNINSKFIKKKYEMSNNIKCQNRNRYNIFNEKLNTDIPNNNDYLKYITPNLSKFGRNKKKIDNNLNNFIYGTSSEIDKDFNINNCKNFHNYFIIKQNKSFNNSKLTKKKENNDGKEALLKKINKRSKIIQINDKLNITNNNNIIFDLNKNSKKKNIIQKQINSSNNKSAFIKNGNHKDLSQKVKRIEIPKRIKIINIHNNQTQNNNLDSSKYYVLSEEANNMIKSYSKKKSKKENQLNRKLDFEETPIKKKSFNYKYKKYNKLNDNLFNINNSYFSSAINKKIKFKNEKRTNCAKQNVDDISQKCVGITLSLPNNENNKNKKIRTNQININFTPYQIQCESLIKNNNSNNLHNINGFNDKESLNNLQYKREYNIKNNCISPNYQLFL